MIRFVSVVTEDFPHGISFDIHKGDFSAIVTPDGFPEEKLLDLMLGMEKPGSGRITLLGSEITAMTENGLLEIRKKIALLHAGGGLISNLRVLENAMLQLGYNSDKKEDEIRDAAINALNRVGYCGSLDELPGHLTLFERRLVGFARILITEPKLVIYNAAFEGVQEKEREKLANLADQFHRETPGRTSLAITSDKRFLSGLKPDKITGFDQVPK